MPDGTGAAKRPAKKPATKAKAKSRFNKKKLPSRHTTVGPERAPHRSYLYAMGLTEKEISQPLVGVATCWNEAAPCNISLSRQAQAAKAGVKAGGGTPREFTTITVTDGIAMGHQGMKSSLVSREIIADSVELTMRGHCYDALVGLAGCDKSLPGMMMSMVRLNVPSVFVYGGTILPGKFQGRDVTVVDVFEGVGQYAAGNMSAEELQELEEVACPCEGSCGGQFTANTMACVAEAMGLALPTSSGAPAAYKSRDAMVKASGVAAGASEFRFSSLGPKFEAELKELFPDQWRTTRSLTSAQLFGALRKLADSFMHREPRITHLANVGLRPQLFTQPLTTLNRVANAGVLSRLPLAGSAPPRLDRREQPGSSRRGYQRRRPRPAAFRPAHDHPGVP